jgi:hypothetical protein
MFLEELKKTLLNLRRCGRESKCGLPEYEQEAFSLDAT